MTENLYKRWADYLAKFQPQIWAHEVMLMKWQLASIWQGEVRS